MLLLACCTCTVVVHAADPMAIADARKLEIGATVAKVAGRVTASSSFRNTAYIQDKTGGIAVFNSTFKAGVQPGDSVVIENATITEFQATTGQPGTGLLELAGTELTFTVIPTERIIPSPKITTIPLVGEALEGMVVKIRRVKFLESGAFQGEVTYTVLDQQGNDFPVRVDGATNMATNSLSIPTDFIDIVGCVSQFRGAYQVIPRMAEDVGLPPVEVDTVPSSRTLDITSWNLEWFGSQDTTKGPSDKPRQRRSIQTVMDKVGADIYALQEVTSDTAAQGLADSIQGDYGALYTYDIPSEQKMCYLYNKATITPVTSGLAVNGGSQAWANGRFPYRLTFDATIDGKVKRYVIFNIHGKATDSATATQDYERRKADAETFHTYLHDFYADSSLFLIGDFNDVLTMSVVDSSFKTPYFSFVDDTARWYSPTFSMEQRGLSSYIGFARSFIDHMFITKDIQPQWHRTFLESPQAYISSYSSTVSDHLPVTTRMFVDGVTGVEEQSASTTSVVRIAPNPASTHGMAEIVVQQTAPLKVILVGTTGEVITLADEIATPQIRLIPLPVSQLANGVYRLVVYKGAAVNSRAFVVAR